MDRFGRAMIAALLVALLVLAVPAAAPASASATPSGSGRVVIVMAPYVTWDDMTSSRMPVTRALLKKSAIGDINIRSGARLNPEVTQSGVALTMSAGSPAVVSPNAPSAYMADQRVDIGTAGELFARSMDVSVGPNAIVYLGLPRVLRSNLQFKLDTVPGALGGSIAQAGGATAAIGNSDGGRRGGDVDRSRPAALLAMNASGLVRFGDVSSSLLITNLHAPYGVSTDITAVRAQYRKVLDQMSTAGGPGMIVLDPGDPERSARFAPDASTIAAETMRRQAAHTVDRVVGLALRDLPKDAVLIIVSTSQTKPVTGPNGFGPVVVYGPGYTGGLLTSSSTHHDGLMTDLDISATVLKVLGIERPVEILGNAAHQSGTSHNVRARVAFLNSLSNTAVAVDTVRPVVQTTYITVTAILLMLCALLMRPMQHALHRWGGVVALGLQHIILLLLAMPVSATLMYVVMRRPQTPGEVLALFGGTTIVVWLIAEVITRKRSAASGIAFVGLFTVAVILIDQLLGAPLSFSGMFSYSPLLGARYYGIGNEGAAIVVGSGLAGLAMLLDDFRDRPWTAAVRKYVPLVLGIAVVVISAAPVLGANVGVIAWGTAAFGVMWVQLNGRKVTWKSVLAMLGFIVLVVAAFSVYDVVFNPSAQTHLGRAWASAQSGGVGQLWLILARKAETNWRVLRATNWSILAIAILVFLGLMRWRPQGMFGETLAAYPAFGVAMTASLWGSLVGYLTEDSGIVIPALVMLYVTGALLLIMLVRMRANGEGAAS